MNKEAILQRLDIRSFYASQLPSLKVNGSDNGQALCPWHEDTNPSLSINLKTGAFNCFGCKVKGSIFDFYMKRNGVDYRTALNSLAREASLEQKTPRKIAATYDYRDEAGTLIFQTVRYEPKDFIQRRPDGKGGFIYNLKGISHIPYNLQAVINAETVIIVEGEKDVETLRGVGLVASCNAMGAGKWRTEYSDHFIGKKVVIIPDSDKPGLDHALQVAGSLKGVVESVKVIELPGLPVKGDVSDWIEQQKAEGKSSEAIKSELLEIVKAAPEWEPEGQTGTGSYIEPSHIQVVSIRDFLSLELPERKVLMSPWLPSQGLCMLYGYRGLGKTYVLLGVAVALSSGSPFLKWQCEEPRKVLYIDGEMPARVMQERISNVIAGTEKEPVEDYLKIITPDLQEDGIPDLSTPEGQAIIEPYALQADVIIMDNISTLCRSGAENKGEDWGPVQSWALRLRRKGISVIFVHHEGKNGFQRGTSKREDVLDTVIKLKRPGDYTPSEGLRVEVHFEKSRGIFGDCVRPFETRLVSDHSGSRWDIKDLEQSMTERVADLLKEGIPQHEIADLLKVSKGTVSKHKRKAQDMGLTS